jgi:hypothetical protein
VTNQPKDTRGAAVKGSHVAGRRGERDHDTCGLGVCIPGSNAVMAIVGPNASSTLQNIACRLATASNFSCGCQLVAKCAHVDR